MAELAQLDSLDRRDSVASLTGIEVRHPDLERLIARGDHRRRGRGSFAARDEGAKGGDKDAGPRGSANDSSCAAVRALVRYLTAAALRGRAPDGAEAELAAGGRSRRNSFRIVVSTQRNGATKTARSPRRPAPWESISTR